MVDDARTIYDLANLIKNQELYPNDHSNEMLILLKVQEQSKIIKMTILTSQVNTKMDIFI